MGFSVGIGLTNDCNLHCAHCYRDTDRIDYISLAQIQHIYRAIPVDAMGMGTGENALNPEFPSIVHYLAERNVRLSIASNGHSLTTIPGDVLCAFHDVEVSILATLMRDNYDRMDQLVALARRNGTNLRVNAYQAVKSQAFRLTYAQFWEGYRRLFAAGLVISCSEPVVRALMGLDDVKSPCGRHSIRFNPRGQVIPCVYWPVDSQAFPGITDLARVGTAVIESDAFRAARQTPPSAADCPCQGGCASRRALNGDLDAHDDYCPWVRGDRIELSWRPAPAKSLMRSGNVCATVVA